MYEKISAIHHYMRTHLSASATRIARFWDSCLGISDIEAIVSDCCLLWTVLGHWTCTYLHIVYSWLYLSHIWLTMSSFFTLLFILLWSLTSSLPSCLACFHTLIAYSIHVLYIYLFQHAVTANCFFSSSGYLLVLTVCIMAMMLWFTHATFLISLYSHLSPHLGGTPTYINIFSWLSLANFPVCAGFLLSSISDIYLNFVSTVNLSDLCFLLPV